MYCICGKLLLLLFSAALSFLKKMCLCLCNIFQIISFVLFHYALNSANNSLFSKLIKNSVRSQRGTNYVMLNNSKSYMSAKIVLTKYCIFFLRLQLVPGRNQHYPRSKNHFFSESMFILNYRLCLRLASLKS